MKILTNIYTQGASALLVAYRPPLRGHTNQAGGHPPGRQGSKLNNQRHGGTLIYFFLLAGLD